MQNISVIYNKLGLSQEYFIPYGKFKAKIDCLEYNYSGMFVTHSFHQTNI